MGSGYTTPHGVKVRAFCIRGLIGAAFSTGMNDLAAELNKNSMISATAEGNSFFPVSGVVGDLTQAGMKAHQSGRRLIYCGHSYGAYAALVICTELARQGIPTALLVLDDTTIDSPPIPKGCADLVLDYFQKQDVMGGGQPKADIGEPILRQLEHVSHIQMDDLPIIHRQVCQLANAVAAGTVLTQQFAASAFGITGSKT